MSQRNKIHARFKNLMKTADALAKVDAQLKAELDEILEGDEIPVEAKRIQAQYMSKVNSIQGQSDPVKIREGLESLQQELTKVVKNQSAK